MKTFKTPFSTGMLISTVVVMAILLWALYTMSMRIFPMEELHTVNWVLLIAVVIILVSILVSFALQVVKIELTDDSLIIKRVWGAVIIPLSEIQSVNRKESIWKDLRTFGIGGFFGYTGHFWSHTDGKYRAYVKDGNCMVRIKTFEKTYVVSCVDCDSLIKELQTHKVQ